MHWIPLPVIILAPRVTTLVPGLQTAVSLMLGGGRHTSCHHKKVYDNMMTYIIILWQNVSFIMGGQINVHQNKQSSLFNHKMYVASRYD